MSSSADGLISEIASRLIEVARLNSDRFIRMQNSVPLSIVVRGLGPFVAQVEFVPITGEWASQIADQLRQDIPADPNGGAGRSGPVDNRN